MENQIEIYQSTEGQTEIAVKFDQDTIWLSQRQMAELFNKDTDTIGLPDREQRGIGRPDLVCGLQQTRRDEHGEKAGHQRTESQSIVS